MKDTGTCVRGPPKQFQGQGDKEDSAAQAVLSVHKLSHATAGFTVLGDIGISFSFGLVLVAAVYMAARVSGAYLNPVVTVALVVNGEFP